MELLFEVSSEELFNFVEVSGIPASYRLPSTL